MLLFYSNTTLVKVKLKMKTHVGHLWTNSNTTLVKVKLSMEFSDCLKQKHSNTTLVKVKWQLKEEAEKTFIFKYNTC